MASRTSRALFQAIYDNMFYAKYVPNETEWKLACPHSSLVDLFGGAATLPEVADMSTDEKKFNL